MKRILSLLITFVMVIGVFALQFVSADGNTQDPNKGMVINKTAVSKGDGIYEITLEAYATGTKVTTSESTDVPTDIILVLDQSGSMANNFSQATADSWVSYGYRSNSENYSDRENNTGYNASKNLYYKRDDGSYVAVSVEQETKQVESYVKRDNIRNGQAYNSRSTFYVKIGDTTYKEVSITRSGNVNNRVYTYTYTDDSGNSVSKTSSDVNGYPPFELYERQTVNEYTYTYSYTIDGIKTEIGKSTGANTVFETAFYKKIESGSYFTALESLKNAVTNFAEAVAEKAAGADGALNTGDDVNHRIAVVGFAGGSDSSYGAYTNTEVFAPNSGDVTDYQYRYGDSATGQYTNAFQSMNTVTGVTNVNNFINVLDAQGGTHIELGLEMANGIFGANPIDNNEKRNRVVIVFTDGVPSGTGNSYNSTVANSAINNASTAKEKYNATVYAVGIFQGANATSAGNQNGNDIQKANWFMQQVSSNNGTPASTGSPSYYLSASNSVSLNYIFQQISSQIESGQSSTTLNSSAVVRDIIAPQFQLPEGATADSVTLETWKYNGEGNPWIKNATAMGATASVNTTTGQVDVTGFDFAANYVVTLTNNDTPEHKGNKLVIKFNVQTKDGFLGGNDVYTNASAGVYENANATEPVLTFPRPTVNVPIQDVTVTAPDKNVYLLGSLTAEQIKSGATVKCGDVPLDLSKADDKDKPYGLEPWQTDYVNIEVTYTDKDGNVVMDLGNLVADTTYTVSATVAPKEPNPKSTQGEKAETKSNSAIGKINVFKPELTYKDTKHGVGETAPTDYTANNQTNVEWKHGDTVADTTKMGAAPTLTYIYTPQEGAIVDGKIVATEDIPVGVAVKIGEVDVTGNVNFIHTKCSDPATCSDPENGKFWLHITSFDLIIKKTGYSQYASQDPNQSFVFDIKGPDNYTNRVMINGDGQVKITGLPAGTYTITEDTSWSWRYTPDGVTKNITFGTGQAGGNTVTFNNTRDETNWLDGNAYVENKWDLFDKGWPDYANQPVAQAVAYGFGKRYN